MDLRVDVVQRVPPVVERRWLSGWLSTVSPASCTAVLGFDGVLRPVPEHQRRGTAIGAAMVQNAAMGLIVRRYRYRPMLPPIPTAHPAKI